MVGKLPRGVRATWLSFDEENWTLVGKDMEDFSTALNPDVSQEKNVLGETTVSHKGYTPSTDVEYNARTEDAIYEKLEKIGNELLIDEASTTCYIIEATLDKEVKESDTVSLTGKGYKAPGIVSVTSMGGSTDGYAINFNWQQNGARTQGTVTVANRKPTFVAGATVDPEP